MEVKNGVDWTEVKRPNPHFYKVLVGDFAKSMKIPPKFLKHLQEETEAKQNTSKSNISPNLTAILEGPTGRTWHVKVEKTLNNFFFMAGWSKFVKDHSLQKHELLIFRYNGSMQFSVLIFDKSSCEKEHIEENEKGNKLGGPKRKLDFEETVISINSSENNSNEGDNEEVISKETSTNSKGKNGETSTSSKGKKGKISTNSKGKKGTQKRKRERISTRRPATETEKENAQKAAQSFASENPFIVLRMNPRSTIRFPMQFSRKYLPRTKCNFVLRVQSNKVWDVTYIPCISMKERDYLSKGWSIFAKENYLEEYDFCAFELIKPTEFQVHIFRVVGPERV